MSSDLGRSLLLHQSDNVAIALEAFAPNTEVVLLPDRRQRILVIETVPEGHKFSIFDIHAGEPVIKYGEVIGLATRDIRAGELVHVHNVASRRGRGDRKELRDP